MEERSEEGKDSVISLVPHLNPLTTPRLKYALVGPAVAAVRPRRAVVSRVCVSAPPRAAFRRGNAGTGRNCIGKKYRKKEKENLS